MIKPQMEENTMGLLRAAATVKAVDHHRDKKEAKKEAKQGAAEQEEKKT
jgi:hypothetical protein